MKTWITALCALWMCCASAFVAAETVLEWKAQGDFDKTYQAIYAALEEHRFFVVFEPNIQANLSNFAERWGEDYNRNQLDGIRAMVFCNGWYANQVSNADVRMLALCPLHLTLAHKAGETRVLFVSPRAVAKGSAAAAIAAELEADVAKAVAAGIEALAKP